MLPPEMALKRSIKQKLRKLIHKNVLHTSTNTMISQIQKKNQARRKLFKECPMYVGDSVSCERIPTPDNLPFVVPPSRVTTNEDRRYPGNDEYGSNYNRARHQENGNGTRFSSFRTTQSSRFNRHHGPHDELEDLTLSTSSLTSSRYSPIQRRSIHNHQEILDLIEICNTLLSEDKNWSSIG